MRDLAPKGISSVRDRINDGLPAGTQGGAAVKKLGILGGMGPESTLMYYREIAMRYRERVGADEFPRLTIEALDMYRAVGLCKSDRLDELVEYLVSGLESLEAAGADFAVLASNTPHVVFDRLQERSRIPLISIVETACDAAASQRIGRIAWLGTGFTMAHPYFEEAFRRRGIEVVSPNEEDRIRIDGIIADELEFGIVRAESKRAIDAVLEALRDERGIEAAVLGCTELPLMYDGASAPVPLFDTARLHIERIMDVLFEEN